MRFDKLILILFLSVVSSCCRCSSDDIETIAEKHQAKLKRHFLSGDSSVDISTLISETRNISARLKESGFKEKANKFDSYTDVLMFGNNTVDESINDVMKLIKKGNNCKCPTFKGFMERLCN